MPWQAALDPAIEVCPILLPGRGARMTESPSRSLSSLATSIAGAIAGQPAQPFAFFGHSLGALLAFEVARIGSLNKLAAPAHLFVSACDAPQHRRPTKALHLLDDDALIAALGTYNGTPQEVLENRELMALVLPVLRADFSLAETYRYAMGPALSVPITVLAGTTDQHVQPEHVGHWQKETSQACRVEWFDGDHFFIQSQQAAVLRLLASTLATVR